MTPGGSESRTFCVQIARVSGSAREPAFEIRRRVFVEEQGVSRAEEFDDLDDVCTHFLATKAGRQIGTARMHAVGADAVAQRVAVLPEARRQGVASRLMREIEVEAQSLGLARVTLHAQLSAIPFYEAIGYTASGQVFHEAGIAHRQMTKQL